LAAPKSEQPISEIISFARLIVSVSGHRAGLALLFLVLGSATEGISILMLLPILSTVSGDGHDFSIALPQWAAPLWPFGDGRIGLATLLAGFVLLVAAQALFGRFKSVYMSQLVFSFINHLRVGLLESVGRANWAAFQREKFADINHALTGEIERIQVASVYSFMLVQSAVLLCAYMVISLIISPTMTALAALSGAAMFAVLKPIRARAALFGRQISVNRKTQYQTITEFLTGFKVAKSLNSEERYFNSFRATLQQMMEDNRRFASFSAFGTAGFQIASALAAAVFLYVALVVQGLSIARILVMMVVFMRLAPRFMEAQAHIQQLLVNIPSHTLISALKAKFDAEREAGSGGEDSPPMRLDHEIRASHLSLAYDRTDGARAISDVSFTIPARQVTALIGHSGAGKTSVADILLGLIDPMSGGFTVDGVKIHSGNRRRWRDHVAYVPQEVFLLHDTISANLRIAAPDASDAELWAALNSAQAGFVAKLEHGLETIVGERGNRLSGGERQRIALARALLRKPQLLILDEATSSLDWQSQALVAQAVTALRGSTTVLTIAHRPSMIAFADWVIAMDQGRVVETGPFAELRNEPGSKLSALLAGEHPDSVSGAPLQ
jgi:ATP-binding cassette subfamily C protein